MLNRDAIDDKYAVFDYLPTAFAREELKWTTNIFIASDLSETRVALADYPAITITFSWNLRAANRELIDMIMNEKVTWMIPYLPHLTDCSIVNDVAVPQTIGGVTYPTSEHYLVFSRGHLVYREASDMNVSMFDGIVNAVQSWVVPCFTAHIQPELSWMDVGKCRDGSQIDLTFRMTGDSEKALTYQSNEFSFFDALQTPLEVEASRRQKNYAPVPARSHVYVPFARKPTETPMVNCRYLLEYGPFVREEYAFRGYFMDIKGAAMADHFVNENTLHRLENDMITIEYQQGIAIASAIMREVAA